MTTLEWILIAVVVVLVGIIVFLFILFKAGAEMIGPFVEVFGSFMPKLPDEEQKKKKKFTFRIFKSNNKH